MRKREAEKEHARRKRRREGDGLLWTKQKRASSAGGENNYDFCTVGKIRNWKVCIWFSNMKIRRMLEKTLWVEWWKLKSVEVTEESKGDKEVEKLCGDKWFTKWNPLNSIINITPGLVKSAKFLGTSWDLSNQKFCR